ncbi:Site-specific recombinase XerC [Priestia megaterium Q3]|uniref:Site-specific recombinase XerC n=1 Tax=Priestia megaterium Q3 TaxID=1452722 RepID=A0A806TGF8_PRIMG|nr:hypothetical protein [Priestia megaterium]AKP77172.1 Site-specific recombinase XerC [Priestia megaterium Q3]
MKDSNIKFSVKKALVATNPNDETFLLEYATIVIEDKKTGFFRPHPLTAFIKDKYSKKDFNYNTQATVAGNVVRFLNWLLIDNRNLYELESIQEMTIEHGVAFLQHMKHTEYNGKSRSRETLEKYDLYLTSFYSWLTSKGLIKGRTAEKVQENTYKNRFNDTITQSIFVGRDFSLPSNSLTRDEFKLEEFPHPKLITLFLEMTDNIAPDITIGIYMQIFGGLRRGEVVNILESELKIKGPNGIYSVGTKIGYKPYLWKRLKDSTKCNVKRNTNIFPFQSIQVIPSLWKPIYVNHMKLLDKYRKVNKYGALFIDRNGNPMSGAVYEKRFANVKKAFLKYVQLNMPEYYSLLINMSWGTHIGRGTYTNLMARIVTSQSELAILRANTTLEAAIVYLSKHNIRKEIQQGLEQMYRETIEKEKQFDDNLIEEINERSNVSKLLAL